MSNEKVSPAEAARHGRAEEQGRGECGGHVEARGTEQMSNREGQAAEAARRGRAEEQGGGSAGAMSRCVGLSR